MYPVKKIITLICFLLSFYGNVFAQLKNEAFLRDNLPKTTYSIDPDANKIILNETQSVEIIRNGYRFEQVYHCYKAIKILKQTGNSDADIFVGYRSPSNLTGATYNLVGDEIVKTPLPDDAIYTRKVTGLVDEIRFSLSKVKEGSIIEYSYDIMGGAEMVLPPWIVQEESPKLFSKYTLEAPNTFNYSQVSQGYLMLKDYPNEAAAIKDNSDGYLVTSALVNDRYSTTCVRRNISAIHPEPFISSVANYAQRMDFQLAGITITSGNMNAIYTTWGKLNKALNDDENFGKQINDLNRFLDHVVDSLTRGAETKLQKIENIFAYVRSNFYCSSEYGVKCSIDNAKVLRSKRGTVADINLLLVAMLKHADIDADPVILSRQGMLRVSKAYPLVDRFNYTICMASIDSNRYLMDASGKFNSFNSLPLYCYNGYARIISGGDGAELNLSVSDVLEKNVYVVNVSVFTDSLIKITVAEKLGKIVSRKLREQWDEDSATKRNYFSEKTQGFSDNVNISNIEIINLDNPDTNLIVKYTLNMSSDKHDVYYLNAQLIKFFKDNPFKENTRRLPIELPYKMDYRYIFNMHVPDNINIDDLPQSTDLKYGDGDMDFKNIVSFDSSSRMLLINTSFESKETAYKVENYTNIKKFFEKMILEESSMITLKKKKPSK